MLVNYAHVKSADVVKNVICSNNQGGPTLDQRFESYYNYCNLFNYILSKFFRNYSRVSPSHISLQRIRSFEKTFDFSTDADGPAPLELPNQWLWDIIDEFIYQVGCFFPTFDVTNKN